MSEQYSVRCRCGGLFALKYVGPKIRTPEMVEGKDYWLRPTHTDPRLPITAACTQAYENLTEEEKATLLSSPWFMDVSTRHTSN